MSLVLYTADWCRPCTELKKWIKDKGVEGIDIRDIDVDVCPVSSISKLPTLVVYSTELREGQVLVGREIIKPFLESLNGN